MSNSAKTHSNLLHPGRGYVHALFDATRFPSDIDYEAFYEGTLLATRLVNTPQGLQHDYSFYFGKTVPADTPSGFLVEWGPDYLPYQYACDKAIGELTAVDIRAVERQRILLAETFTFEVHDNIPPYAQTAIDKNAAGEWISTIRIHQSVYTDALAKKSSPEQNARENLKVACIFIHEVAHAAHKRLFGAVRDDWCEESHIAEAGFEAVARLFGFTPKFSHGWNTWTTWQCRKTSGPYDLTKIGRNVWELPDEAETWLIAPEFVMKLSEDEFWEGEYVQRGAYALVADDVPELCKPGKEDDYVYQAIPLSIRDLFRTEGPSYAKTKYAQYASPERQLRRRPDHDERFRKMPSVD